MLLLALATAPQEGLGRAETRALERFADLPAAERERVEKAVFEAVLATDQALLRAAAALLQHPRHQSAVRLAPESARAFAAEDYAPALALKTKTFTPESAAWKAVHRRLLGGRSPPPWPPDRMRWDPGRDALILPEQPLASAAALTDLLLGRWPGDDRMLCAALAALDDEPKRNPTADYFEHAYRNRNGGIYAGIRLADVWDCGREFEVSDVEAIAWLRLVGGGTQLVSPIPGSRHLEIYGQIEASFVAWRAHWSLREALAARMLEPWTDPDPMWRGVRDDLDRAWILAEHDPMRMSARLSAHPGRVEFFAAVRAEYAAALDEAASAQREVLVAARAELAEAISTAARAALREEGLLGLGAR